MNIKVQKQDGSQVEVATNPVYKLKNSGAITSFPKGANNPHPSNFDSLTFNTVMLNNIDEAPGQYITHGYLQYGYSIELSGFGDSAVQMFFPFLYSGLTYGHAQAPIYIRSTQDNTQTGVEKGWTAWRRLAFYDEVEAAKTSCPFPVGFSFMSINDMNMSSSVGGTWSKTKSPYRIAFYSNSSSVSEGCYYYTYTRTA